MDFSPLDVVIGGRFGYAEHISTTGAHLQHIELRDDDTNLMKVWGATFTPDEVAYFALGQRASYEDYTPHDVCYIPRTKEPYKLAVLIGRTNDTVELWIYDTDNTVLQTFTGLNKDTDWVHTMPLKLAIACDGDTVYYTDQSRTIFRYSLTTGQLPIFDQLPIGSPYIFGGIEVQPDGDLYRAMTTTGTGPRRDVCLGGTTSIWTDIVNPPASTYKAFKRHNVTQIEILNHTVSLSPTADNDEILCLACNYYACVIRPRRRQPQGHVVS